MLEGTGTVSGSVVNSGGTIKPGDSPGTLTINGSYSQSSSGHLGIEFTNSAHGLLVVQGTASPGGVLDISYLGPRRSNGQYLINPGDPGSTSDFLTFGTLTNSGLANLFSNEYAVGGNYFVNGITSNSVAGAPAQYQLAFDPNNSKALQLTLTTAAAPEPSESVSLGGGLLAVGFLAVRRAWSKRKAA